VRRSVCVIALLVAACQVAIADTRQLTRFEFVESHMGTTFRIVLYAGDDDAAARASRAAYARIADLDKRLSDYHDDSELMRAARDAVQKPVSVSADLFRVLATAQALAERTDGAFDVTAGALTRVWRHARRQGVLPDPGEVDAARRVSGYRLLRLDDGARAIRIEREGVRLDVGGIAKGYAADRALDVLGDAGLTRAMVVAGGDIAVADPPPGACGWRIAIAPLTSDTAPGAIVVSHAGVSTSGDAEQFMEVDGVRYSHILDTRTGKPLTGRRAVTVVAPDATTSDMLATALSVLGAPDGLRLADEFGAAARFEIQDGSAFRRTDSPRWSPAGPIVGAATAATCAEPPAW
jgi:thiamine biosynthesis lipoprotein